MACRAVMEGELLAGCDVTGTEEGDGRYERSDTHELRGEVWVTGMVDIAAGTASLPWIDVCLHRAPIATPGVLNHRHEVVIAS